MKPTAGKRGRVGMIPPCTWPPTTSTRPFAAEGVGCASTFPFAMAVWFVFRTPRAKKRHVGGHGATQGTGRTVPQPRAIKETRLALRDLNFPESKMYV
jgi:hypothetical protein